MAPRHRQPLGGQGVLRISGRINTKTAKVRVATVNVGTMVGKSMEVVEMLKKKKS